MKRYENNGGTVKDAFCNIVQTMINEMENATGRWVKTWASPYSLPRNMVSKERYRGLNSFHLSNVALKEGYKAPYWLTFKQVNALGGRVKKGEKATDIFFFKTFEKIETNIDNETGEETVITKQIPVLKNYKVFNVEQTEGIEYELPKVKINDNERYQNAEDFIQCTKASIRYGGDRSFYDDIEDYIQVPEIQFFINSDSYYAALLHELTHWTGSNTRLARIKYDKWGDSNYAFEELVAELGAVFLCSHLGISIETSRHPEYLKSWIKTLKEDPKILWKAASKAQEAFDFIINVVENNLQADQRAIA